MNRIPPLSGGPFGVRRAARRYSPPAGISYLVNFHPLQSNCYVDDGVTLCVAGDPIKRVYNAGTLGGYFAEATLANRPTLELVNGVYVMRFAGGSPDRLTASGVSLSGGTTLCLLMKKTTSNDGGGYGHFGTASSDVHTNWTDGSAYDSYASTTRQSFTGPTWTSWTRYIVTSASGNWTARTNGSQAYTTATNTVGFQASPRIGGMTSNNYMLTGDIAQFRIAQTLSSGDIASVESEFSTIITDLSS